MLPGGTYREEYVKEALAWGWHCPSASCRTWNGDEPTFRITCEKCGANRPRKEEVVRGTKGKR
jgi:hypothetical protein